VINRGLTIRYLFLILVVSIFIGSCSRANKIPDEIREFAEKYLYELSNGEEKPLEMVYFKDEYNMERTDNIEQGGKLLDYKIDKIEKINDDLFVFTILYKLEMMPDVFQESYNYIGRIDDELKFIIHQRNIPDEIKDGFNSEKYTYSFEDIAVS
jgi:hypothetical protein